MTTASGKGKETVQAAGFVLLLGLMFGGVGIVVAALAVGVERSMSGRGGRGTGRGWREHVSNQEDWWDADRQYRARRRIEHRKWWAEGADPANRPDPERGRFGKFVRRAWAAVVIGADRVAGAGSRFGKGAQDGGRAANDVRKKGGTFREVAGARPGKPGNDDPESDDYDFGLDDYPTTETRREADDDVAAAARPAGVAFASATTTPQTPLAEQPDGGAPPPQQEEPVTAPTTTAPAQSAPGDTNLDQTVVDLSALTAKLAQIEEANDALAGHGVELDGLVSQAYERAVAAGAPAATMVALDQAAAVSAELKTHLTGVSDATVAARDVTDAAIEGLAPAQDAQDTLHAAGARGEFVSAAN